MPSDRRSICALRQYNRLSSSRTATPSGRRYERLLASPRRSGHSYSALTLIELLLVLALLVVIGSMIVPVFTGSFANIRLRRASDQLISSWSEARKLAIETGVVYQFTFTPETGEYQIGPWLGELQQADGSSTASTTTSTATSTTVSTPGTTTTSSSSASAGADATTETEETPALPTDIVFHAGQLAAAEPVTQERRVDSLVARGGDESTPILFFPDGTTSEASVVLANDRRQYVRVTLRSLTGVGRASEVMTSDELQRSNARGR